MALRIVAVVIIVGLTCLFWLKKQQTETQGEQLQADIQDEDQPAPYEALDIEGVEPDGEPEFDVNHELRIVGERNVMFFTVTERHGWYADHIYVEFWYEEQDEAGEWRQIGNSIHFLMKGYVDFGATLEDNTTLLDYEFPEIDGFGTTENWRARVGQSGKILAPKPG